MRSVPASAFVGALRIIDAGDLTRLTDAGMVITPVEMQRLDIGLAGNGIPYFAYLDPIPPTSAIVFHHPADGSFHPSSYPGGSRR